MDPKTNAESISSSVEEEKKVTKEVKEIEKKLKNGEEIVLGSKVDENDDMESLAPSQCLVSRNEDGFTILPFADTYLFLSPTFSNNEIEAEHTFFVGESRVTHLGKKSGNNEWKIEYKGQNKDPIKIKEEVKTIYIGRDSYKNNFAIPFDTTVSREHHAKIECTENGKFRIYQVNEVREATETKKAVTPKTFLHLKSIHEVKGVEKIILSAGSLLITILHEE